MTGTDETSSEASKFEAGCPCGRSHSSTRVFRRRSLRKPESVEPLYEGVVDGRAVQDPDTGFWWLALHRDCANPYILTAHGGKDRRTMWKKIVRCRDCDRCLRAKQFHWARRALRETERTTALGGRTWFGTLTLTPDAQGVMLDRAKLRSDEDANDEMWSDPFCDVRFNSVRRELHLEVRRAFARLRKCGHRFSYMLVFERHLGGGASHGLPHMHFLLHEKGPPIRKLEIQSQWPWGFSNCKLVGGKAKDAPHPAKAAFYVAKYLGKSKQARQIASKDYGSKEAYLPSPSEGEGVNKEVTSA